LLNVQLIYSSVDLDLMRCCYCFARGGRTALLIPFRKLVQSGLFASLVDKFFRSEMRFKATR
jgi:hypothetical protein